MPKLDIQPFDHAGLLAYMQEAKGIQFQCSDLAKVFGKTTSAMRICLFSLIQSNKIKSLVVKGAHVYFIPAATEAEPVRDEKWKSSFKAYTLPQGIGDRCRELYPEDHRLITVHQNIAGKR
jgi:hypothetical protein